jgi:hypothetical protein
MESVSQEYFDIVEETKYTITISKPANILELSDCFMTEEEILERASIQQYTLRGMSPGTTKTIVDDEAIKRGVEHWVVELKRSGKKSIQITDQDLLDNLTTCIWSSNRNVRTITNQVYTKHGDRILRFVPRRKTRATRGDLRELWWDISRAWKEHVGTWTPHIPQYSQTPEFMAFFKKALGWRRVRKSMRRNYDETRAQFRARVKFKRYIWDHPEEFKR